MSNQITAKIIKILPAQTGTGKNGTWIKNEFVVETMDQYPKKVCISTWGDLASNIDSYQIGEKVTVHYNPESREYNEKWFTEIRAWKIERDGAAKASRPKEETESNIVADTSDDLPF